MKNNFFPILIVLLFFSCSKDALLDTSVEHHFFLENDDANMPVVVEGNTASKTFLVMIHGGPGGDAMVYKNLSQDAFNAIEEEFAMVYWDQRLSGISTGNATKDKLNINQYVDDLEALVHLLKYRYGQDVGIFLMGHSWGGTLGTGFIVKEQNQELIKGWINVSGLHNKVEFEQFVRDRFLEVAPQEIDAGHHVEDWQEVQDFCQSLVDKEVFTDDETSKLNSYGHLMGFYLQEDGRVNEENGGGSVFNHIFFSNADPLLAIQNVIQIARPVFDSAEGLNFTNDLESVNIPGLYIAGEYDMVIPKTMLEQAYNHHGGDKEFILFERSAHNPMDSESEKFSTEVLNFIRLYR